MMVHSRLRKQQKVKRVLAEGERGIDDRVNATT